MSGKKRFLGIAALAVWTVLALSCGGGGGGGGTGTGGLAIFYSPDINPPPDDPGDVVLRESGASTPSNLILEVVVYGDSIEVYGIAFQLRYDPTVLQFQSASEDSILNADNCNSDNCTLLVAEDCAIELNSCGTDCKVQNSCPFIVVGLTRLLPPCDDCADVVDGGSAVDCTNGIDDDGDSSIDEADCINGIDDDDDGLTDETGGIDFVAGANVVMTLRFTAAAAGGPSNLFFLEPHAKSVVNDWALTDLSNDWIGGTVSVTVI
jgi:hypothetical protein